MYYFFPQVAGFSEIGDEEVINKIHQLVGQGVQNIRKTVGKICIYVKNDLLHDSSIPPPASC